MALLSLTDGNDPRLRPFSGMTDGQLKRGEGFRRDNPEGLFIGESARVIERALDAGVCPKSVLAEGRWLRHDGDVIERILREYPDVPIFEATAEQFRSLTGYEVVRGALACFERPSPRSLESVLPGARRIAILEDVTNYANMGAIFRSAAALGVDAVLLSPSCHDPYYRRCARVSMGAVFQVPWVHLEGKGEWAPSVAAILHDHGFTLVAMALEEEASSLRDPSLRQAERLAIAFGTEGEGLHPATIAACERIVSIPMAHGVDSLNVAACAAIAFWEIC